MDNLNTAAPGDDEGECSKHPCAPHGFNRNASHSEDRYVCDCEGWSPDRGCAGLELQARLAAVEAELAALRAGIAAAYEHGWHECAKWAERDDLHADVGSKAYADARDARLLPDSGEVV